MNDVLIPWDFFGLLAVVFLVLAVIVCCVIGLKARRRARLTDPRKDHVRRRGNSRMVRE